MVRSVASAVAVIVLAASCSSSGVTDDAIDSTAASNPAVQSPPSEPSLDEFCAEFEALQGERPASYVGSAEHLADIEALLAVAPAEISGPVTVFRDYVASGVIDSANDPDSNLFDNWPAEVRSAVGEIQSFGADC